MGDATLWSRYLLTKLLEQPCNDGISNVRILVFECNKYNMPKWIRPPCSGRTNWLPQSAQAVIIPDIVCDCLFHWRTQHTFRNNSNSIHSLLLSCLAAAIPTTTTTSTKPISW